MHDLFRRFRERLGTCRSFECNRNKDPLDPLVSPLEIDLFDDVGIVTLDELVGPGDTKFQPKRLGVQFVNSALNGAVVRTCHDPISKI
jgi:hypothetical protein